MSISYPVHLRHAMLQDEPEQREEKLLPLVSLTLFWDPVLDVGLPRTVTDGSLPVLELAILAGGSP